MISSFTGKYRFLSNFYPTLVVFAGVEYPTVEHAYQALKTLDIDIRVSISKLPTPGAAKKFGKKISLRLDWERRKVEFMLQLLRRKFEPGSELAQRLLLTGEQELCEGNWWGDTFWGVCNGEGENNLGKLLMQVRSELLKVS